MAKRREMKQQPIWMGAGLLWRTVREITVWDGRTVGVVRNGRGAEYVVWKSGKGDRWDALTGVSVTEIRNANELAHET